VIMSESIEPYEVLKKRINEIIDNFSFEQDPTSMPTPQQQDMVRAMIVLCHAEFEDYIERLASDLLSNGEQEWINSSVANKNIAALFLEHDKICTSDTIATKSRQAIKNYRDDIKTNHGIKTSNLIKLYKPLGYKVEEEFDSAFLSELESFGTHRGEVAHSSSSRMIEMLDYNSEKQKILRILDEIGTFQKAL